MGVICLGKTIGLQLMLGSACGDSTLPYQEMVDLELRKKFSLDLNTSKKYMH